MSEAAEMSTTPRIVIEDSVLRLREDAFAEGVDAMIRYRHEYPRERLEFALRAIFGKLEVKP